MFLLYWLSIIVISINLLKEWTIKKEESEVHFYIQVALDTFMLSKEKKIKIKMKNEFHIFHKKIKNEVLVPGPVTKMWH